MNDYDVEYSEKFRAYVMLDFPPKNGQQVKPPLN